MAGVTNNDNTARVRVRSDLSRYYATTAKKYSDNAETSATNAAASADLARLWATKTDSTVDGEEYSAKYYAQQAKVTFNNTQKITNIVTEYKDNIKTVSDNISNVNTVSKSIGDVNTCAKDIAAIKDAPTQAQNASNSAATATEQANIATEKADNANNALAQTLVLINSLGYFQFISGGDLDSTPTGHLNGGDLDSTPTLHISGGNLDTIRAGYSDLENINKLPLLKTQVSENETNITTMQTQIKDLTTKLNGALEYIASIKQGIRAKNLD